MYSFIRLVCFGLLFWLMIGGLVSAQAGVVAMGTRVIFPGDQREVSVRLDNKGKLPALVQLWIDHGEESASPDTIKVPFTVSPPVARIEAGKGQLLRVIYTGDALPNDRESVFWLNILDVPPKSTSSANHLQFSFRTRIKLFYRPKVLTASGALDAMKSLRWIIEPNGKNYNLRAVNDSPYYVSFSKVILHSGGIDHEVGGGMVDPKAEGHFPIPGLDGLPVAGATVEANEIDDYGAIIHVNKLLSLSDSTVK